MNTVSFQNHLHSIPVSDWEKLFCLIEEIDSTKNFGEIIIEEGFFPYWEFAPVVSRFFSIAHELQILPVFNWVKWNESEKYFKAGFPFETLDNVTLCKILAAIIRQDRFADGTLISNFQSGTIKKIILALKLNLQKQNI